MPKGKQPKNVACYWQSDSSPIPKIKVEKVTTQWQAERWLSKQVTDTHWTPKIGVLTVETEDEPIEPVSVEEVIVEAPDITVEEINVEVSVEEDEED
jgi:hypothetical protein